MFGYEVRDGVPIRDQLHGDSSKFQRELMLAKRFVLGSEKPENVDLRCPVCGARDVDFFFEKWGVAYYLCTASWTLFAPALPKEATAFEKASELSEFRRTKKYQEVSTENRQGVWKSFIDWMEHRVFRYSGKLENRVAMVHGLRYQGLLDLLRASPLFSSLSIKDSLLFPDSMDEGKEYDTLFHLDTLQRCTAPLAFLKNETRFLSKGGLLFLNTRVGSGYDILTLRGRTETVFPYEHIFLPSPKGVSLLLEKAGFQVLEASTPGMFDTMLVYRQRESLGKTDYFSRLLMDSYDERMFADFQKFLQKHGLSSTVRIVAVKQ